MSPGARRPIILLALIALSCAAGWVLMTVEMRIAPIPAGLDDAAMDHGINSLVASMWRWQAIYLPLLGLAVVLGAALLLEGKRAWLDAVIALIFVVAMVVMVQSTTVSWLNSAIVAVAYLVIGGAIAQMLRKRRTK